MDVFKKYKVYTLLAVTCILLFFVAKVEIGMMGNSLEEHVRKSANIDDSWYVEESINDDMAAYIFYDKKTRQNTFLILVNRPGLSFGYHDYYGGSLPELDEAVGIFKLESNDSVAYISMNVPEVSRIQIGAGEDTSMIVIDPKKPFAVVIEKNRGLIQLFNKNEELVMPVEI